MIRHKKVDGILAIIRAEPGVTTQQLAERVFLSVKSVSNLLGPFTRQGAIVSVRSKNAAVWATPEAAAPMRAAIQEDAKRRKTAVEKASRHRWIEPDDDDVPGFARPGERYRQ